jgi:hypothetical protein
LGLKKVFKFLSTVRFCAREFNELIELGFDYVGQTPSGNAGFRKRKRARAPRSGKRSWSGLDSGVGDICVKCREVDKCGQRSLTAFL